MSRASETRRWLPLLVSAITLVWLFSAINPGEVARALRWDAVWILLPAILAYGGITLAIEASSLVLLVPPSVRGFSWLEAARAKAASYLVGIVNYLFGAGALSVLLRRRSGLSLEDAAGAVLVITAVDFGLVLSACIVAVTLFETEALQLRMGLLIGWVAAAVTGVILVRSPIPWGPLESLRSRPLFRALRLTPFLALVQLLLLRISLVFLFFAAVGTALYAYDIPFSIPGLVVKTSIVTVVAALPIAVAGLGTGQIAFVQAFEDNAPEAVLLACNVMLSVGMIAMRVGIGMVFAREYAREAVEAQKQAQEET